MSNTINTLILGDLYGQPGVRAVYSSLKSIIKERKADFIIVNGENAVDGFGITPAVTEQILSVGADVITTGNHVWQQKEIFPLLDSEKPIIRPANYPPMAPGKGWVIIEKKGVRIGVLNLQGRLSMSPLDCPFQVAMSIIKKLKAETDGIIVDFHAESVEEKEALALYLDGKVSLVLGTHTHVQTADERILAKGTGYITDIGMCGPALSVIGSSPDVSVRRFLTQLPLKIVVSDNVAVISGIVAKIDIQSGKTLSLERFQKESIV